MRVHLLDLESQFDRILLEEATEVVRQSHEFDLTQPEPGYYHCISKQPDYHVEMVMRDEGLVQVTCHCTSFNRHRRCKHAIAGLLLLREQLLKNKQKRRKEVKDREVLDDVLKKIQITELRRFISQYSRTHSIVRAEMLANYLHLTRKPDYHSLLSELTPIDRYGAIKINRNQIKHVRNIVAIILRQAQILLKEKSPGACFNILEAAITYLNRIMLRVPQFNDQLSTELKLALRLFEAMCQQTMAPRLQRDVIDFTIDISGREHVMMIKGIKPMLMAIEPFLLEEKSRTSAFQIAEKKVMTAADPVPWAALVSHWMRIWQRKPTSKQTELQLVRLAPDMIAEMSKHARHEDIVDVVERLPSDQYPSQVKYAMWMTGLRAARQTGNHAVMTDLAFRLASIHFDLDAFDVLIQNDLAKAEAALDAVELHQPPGISQQADEFILKGYELLGDTNAMLKRLKGLDDITLWMKYDHHFLQSHREVVLVMYSGYVRDIREAYGGVIARQKLSNIFGHLKSIQLYTELADMLKSTEKKNVVKNDNTNQIKGFVFDLDGVIVDTAVHHFESWRVIMRQLGTEIADEDDAHTRGASRMESFEYLLNRYNISLSQEEKEQWAARKNQVYLEAIEQITPKDLLPGAHLFLEESRQAGLKLALGSASKNARMVLNKLDISDMFDAILDGNDAQASKPDPEIFTKACEALSLDPAQVVVFEDAAKGVQAAVSAGCSVVGIGDPDTLYQADIIISGLDATTPAQIIEQLS